MATIDTVGNDITFPKSKVESALKQSIQHYIKKDMKYDYSKSYQWTNNIVELTMKKLADLGMPYKWIVNVMIMQNNGAGFSIANSSILEPYSDGMYLFKFEGKEFHVVGNVLGFSM